jgi:hypothetical protein
MNVLAEPRMATDPILLIDLVYKNSRQQNLLLPQLTRLIKLMYLSEVEYFRENRGRLTDLNWKFYLYGPYPPSLQSVLGDPEIESNEWNTGKISKHIVRDEDTFMRAKGAFEVEAIVNRVVKDWGDADLNQLLDYVYFETEPMQKAKRGDDLDFSTVEPAVRKKVQIALDRSKLNELRKHLAERAKAYAGLRQPAVPSADLSENLEIWDKEEAKIFPSGPCKVRLNDLVPE